MKPSVNQYGERAILMEWKQEIRPDIHEQVVATSTILMKAHSDAIQEIIPSYQSLLIVLKQHADLKKYIKICRQVSTSIISKNENSILWKVPVCYSHEFGFDLQRVAESTKLSTDEIIQTHSSAIYRIYGMGFLPGFLYLGGLNERIYTPRKANVHPSIPKGSVAIGGQQTGIYPQNSPGGWNIIGRTPIHLFDVKKDRPSPFSVGDSISFYPISTTEFERIEEEIRLGTFQLKRNQYD